MSPAVQPYHTFMDYPDNFVLPGVIVPQKVYVAQQPYDRFPTVRFSELGYMGVKLQNALTRPPSGLHDGDKTPRLADKAKKITLRVNWPGYSTWSEIIHIYDHTYDANPVTKKKLAYAIAQKIRQCLQDLREARSTEPTNDWWASRFSPENLILLELRHVSAGSWQPVLAVSS